MIPEETNIFILGSFLQFEGEAGPSKQMHTPDMDR